MNKITTAFLDEISKLAATLNLEDTERRGFWQNVPWGHARRAGKEFKKAQQMGPDFVKARYIKAAQGYQQIPTLGNTTFFKTYTQLARDAGYNTREWDIGPTKGLDLGVSVLV
tara:strand:+ start:137 stop:475 length:339 start_codon:yes stop_codon:yes gene_type:complete